MTYTLPSFGVCFGDVDDSYSASDVTAAVGAISNYFSLIRTYDSFHTVEKYSALMDTAEAKNVDVILGIPNDSIQSFNATDFLTAYCYKSDGTTPRPNLKCIIVGNETYGGDKYTLYAPYLADCVTKLITAIEAKSELKDLIAVSIDFGPSLYLPENLSDCDFTGGDNSLKSDHIVNAMKVILNSTLTTPKMVFGNLYPFYKPGNTGSLTRKTAMITQYAGADKGWYPYSASLQALNKYGLSDLTVNCGETGWATQASVDTQTQPTSIPLLNTYLGAYKDYIDNPSNYPGTNEFKGKTSIFFEMFDEPKKYSEDKPWEAWWGMYEQIVPNSGTAPKMKDNLTIPFSPS